MSKESPMSGACRFCGQIQILTPEIMKEHDPDLDSPEEIATLHCTCKEGKFYRDEKRDLDAAFENIDYLFEKFDIETRDFLKEAAKAVRKKYVERLTVKVSEDITATIKLKGSDHIVVERKKTEKDTLETF